MSDQIPAPNQTPPKALPAWYFDPMQKYATKLAGEYLIGVMMESH